MTNTEYKKNNKYSKLCKLVFLKENRISKELFKNNFLDKNIEKIIIQIYQIYKTQKTWKKTQKKLRIYFQNQKEFKDFQKFFLFDKLKEIKTKKWINTIMRQTISKSKFIPSISLFIETFIDYKNNKRYSRIYIVIN